MNWIYIVGIVVVLLGASAFFGAPYVPTKRRELRRMFDELYPLSKKDTLLDIGSGDGVVLREASRRGARAVGFEISPIFWVVSKLLSLKNPQVSIKLCNAWSTPFPKDVTVVYAFAVERDAKKLVRAVQRAADTLNRPLVLICYGSPLASFRPTRSFEAYSLYTFQPLHPTQA